jgi:hypothetical protein
MARKRTPKLPHCHHTVRPAVFWLGSRFESEGAHSARQVGCRSDAYTLPRGEPALGPIRNSRRHHEKLAHHALILVLQDVAVIHVRGVGVCEIGEPHQERNRFARSHLNRVFAAELVDRRRGAISTEDLELHVVNVEQTDAFRRPGSRHSSARRRLTARGQRWPCPSCRPWFAC